MAANANLPCLRSPIARIGLRLIANGDL